jgi:hypothetical protein
MSTYHSAHRDVSNLGFFVAAIYHLLTCPDLKQVGHFMQCPMHVWLVHLVEHVHAHLADLMKKGPCNLMSGCVLYVHPHI